jgi:hypothetical protein
VPSRPSNSIFGSVKACTTQVVRAGLGRGPERFSMKLVHGRDVSRAPQSISDERVWIERVNFPLQWKVFSGPLPAPPEASFAALKSCFASIPSNMFSRLLTSMLPDFNPKSADSRAA